MIRHLIILLFCMICGNVYAQPVVATEYDFATRAHIIFKDNFHDDSTGSAPSHWLSAKKKLALKEYACVYKSGTKNVLTIKTAPEYNDEYMPAAPIEPALVGPDYLPDNFTLELDFLMTSDSSSVDMYLYSDNALMPVTIKYSQRHGWQMHFSEKTKDGHGQQLTQTISGVFDYSVWHYLAVSYSNSVLSVFLDQDNIFNIVTKYDPAGFTLVNSGSDSVRYTNIKLATGEVMPPDFNRLLATNIFATHSIHFDANKWEIKPRNKQFIKQLAAWLKKNPSVKLQVGGYADTDSVSNMELSQKRANAIKEQLVYKGIDGARITTKNNRSWSSNAIERNKALSRRVEFIRK